MGDANDKDLVATLRRLDRYPRSAAYDPRWVLDNRMGPNVLWLAEALCDVLELLPGMRVLDLGCGKALSSIFLAQEFGVEVWAADLWIEPSPNWARVREAGLERSVFPIRTEAHDLPFAESFFDAIVSADAYHYFGTDDLYLAEVLRFLVDGGRLGIVVPGLLKEIGDEVPDNLEPYWEPEFWSFHTPAWWRSLWSGSGLVEVEVADCIPNGAEDWRLWSEISLTHGNELSFDPEKVNNKQEAEHAHRRRWSHAVLRACRRPKALTHRPTSSQIGLGGENRGM